MNNLPQPQQPVSRLDNGEQCDDGLEINVCDETPTLAFDANGDKTNGDKLISGGSNVTLDTSDGLVLFDDRPSRSDALKNRRVLMDTAARLFAQQGVDEITMSAVAQAAGVGKGTLYRHFASKAELCHALLDQEQRDLQEHTLRRLRTATYPPLDDLHWFVEQVVCFVYRNVSLLNTFDDPTVNSLDFPGHQWWWQTMRALLVRVGTVNDLDYAVNTLYVMLDAHTIQFQTQSRGYDRDRVVAGLHDLIDRFVR